MNTQAICSIPGFIPAADVVVFRPAIDDAFPLAIEPWFSCWQQSPTDPDDILALLRDMDDEAREHCWRLVPKWDGTFN